MQDALTAITAHPGLMLILNTTLRSLVLFALVGAIYLLMRRASAASRHLMLLATVVGLLCLPGLSLVTPPWEVYWMPSAEGAMPAAEQPVPTPSATLPPVSTPRSTPKSSLPAHLGGVEPAAATVHLKASDARGAVLTPLSVAGWLFAVWLTGALLCLGCRLWDMRWMWQVTRRYPSVTDGPVLAMVQELERRTGLRRRIHLRQATAEDTRFLVPMTWGCVRPTLLLPSNALESWPHARLQAVLLHEMAHIARQDWLTHLLAQCVCALYWFHPLVWLLTRQMQREAEQACDDRVLRAGVKTTDYAEYLLEIVRAMKGAKVAAMPGGVQAMASSQSTLQTRFCAILDPHRDRSPITARALCIVLLGMCLILIPAASLHLAAGAAPDDGNALNGDARLNQKVEITAEGIPVGDLLSLLSTRTGVKLKADSYVADDKVIVFNPARPLRDVLTDLASLFNDRWQSHKERNGEITYLLLRDIRAKAYEDGLGNNLAKKMMAQLDEAAHKADANPAALAHQPEEAHPASDKRRAVALYACLSAEQRQQLFTTGRLNLSFEQLTPEQQIQVRSVFDVMATEEQEQFRRDREATPQLLDDTSKPEDVLKGGLRFGLLLSNSRLIARIGSHFTIELSIDTPDTPRLPLHGNPYNGNKLATDARLPDAERSHAAAGQGKWPDILHKLAEDTGVPLMADYYRTPLIGNPDMYLAPPKKDGQKEQKETVQALDLLCRPHGCLWWTSGKTLLFRNGNWYSQRQYEVPDRWILEVSKRLKKSNAQPAYSDMVLLSELTLKQMRGLNSIPERPENSLIRSAADEYWMSGISQLLVLLKNSQKATTAPLLYHNPREPYPEGFMDKFTLTDADCAPDLLQAYLSAQNDLLYAPDYIGLHTYMFRPLDSPQSAANGYQYVPVTLVSIIEKRQGTILDFLMPLSLPDDRHDKTRITLAP
ncbi:MAG TPA: M56 family metallopeptidase [Chthonomonadaceae bacterium]|nr:M56 family metallopeptidase [Chthonomonadaceae bacterium]